MNRAKYKWIGIIGIILLVIGIVIMIGSNRHKRGESEEVLENIAENVTENADDEELDKPSDNQKEDNQKNSEQKINNEKDAEENNLDKDDLDKNAQETKELEKESTINESKAQDKECLHKWEYDEILSPTCEEEGRRRCKCAICGESYEEKVSALGHDESGWILDRKATKQHEGHHYKICARCNAYLREESLPRIEGKDDWIMTNYVDASGDQGMFYTFYNRLDGALIVIDGGKAPNTNQVRSVINSYGGYVDAWFVTHYHDDHVSPFNSIFADPQGIFIEKVYVSPMDYDYYAQVAESWDRLDCFTQFLNVTANASNVEGVQKGQWITIDDLSFHIISAYSEEIKNYGDIPNNASIAMIVRGMADSILFCSDCENDELAMSWKAEFGEELCVDYLQPGHHGNSWISYDFYDFVNPQVVLFDAPRWEMVDDRFKAKALKEHMESRGSLCYDYTTGNHSFEFR